MRIPLDKQSHIPLYQQIETFLRHGILTGGLAVGTRLPSTRQLAQDLGVSRITVENAYLQLEADSLINSRIGSGSYVAPQSQLPQLPSAGSEVWPLWQQELSEQLQAPGYRRGGPRLEAAETTGQICFDRGIGATCLFPVAEFRQAVQDVLKRDGLDALDYGERSGHYPLRHTIAKILSSQGIQSRAEQVLVTAGSQQALMLVCMRLLKPGDTLLVESPTYMGILELARALHLKVVGIPVDEEGMRVEELEATLQRVHPRLLYTIPTFHNPTGTCMSLRRRRLLVALADKYNIPILEDDFVGELRYEGRTLPALKALDPGGRVIYVSTFSKMLMPGLRVGFLVSDGPVQSYLADAKWICDLATSNLIQHALNGYVTVGRFQMHLNRCVRLYRKRREAMLQAIRRLLPAGVRVNPPQGGLFLWLTLPDGQSCLELLPLAREEGVTFSPGTAFFAQPADGTGYMRLNFAAHTLPELEEGIRRLAQAWMRLPGDGPRG